jgi:type I restriction enzyme S subunit
MSRTPTLFDTGKAENGRSESQKDGAGDYQYTRHLGKIPRSWEVRRIQDLVEELTAGTSVGGEKRPREDGEIGVLRVSSVTSGRFKPEKCKVVDPEDYDRLRTQPKPGSILLNRANGTLDLVGISVHVEGEYPNLYLPDKLWRIIPDSNEVASSRWLAALFNTGVVRAKVREYASGKSTGMKNVTQKDFLSIPAPVPPLEEQSRIAEILDTWNCAIEQVDCLIGKKEERQQGIRQRLLTGGQRFPEFIDSGEMKEVDIGEVPADWTQQRLGDLFTWKTKKNEDNSIEKVITVGKDEIRDQEEHFNQSVASDDLSNYRIIEPGDFVYDPMSAYYGALGRYDLEEPGVVSPAYRVLQLNDGYHSDFVKFLLESHYVRFRIDASSLQNNKSGKRRGLRQDAFASIQVHIPPIEEQRRIAQILGAAETEIQKLKEKREALKRQKKGLMQRLLTGAVRTV